VVSVVPRLAPGSTFAERFRIVSYVGQGSMGSVYRAESLAGGGDVALKITKLDVTHDPRALRRFQRGAESGARLDSPYIARTLDSGTLGDGGLAWIAMELAEGDSLQELVERRGRLPPADAKRVLGQLFAALAAAHAGHIVHRDLKPENVRVAGEGAELRVKVLDFGIAKDFGVDTLSGTAPGLGTPLWTAPEQTREGYAPRPSADVWALGLLTFYALTGAPYWRNAAPRASMADLAIELIKGELVSASERVAELGLEAELPPGFDAWFTRAVVREPEARFADAAQAWQALEPLLAPPSHETAKDRAAVVLPRPAVFLSFVILSCVAMGFTIYWLLRSARI
jgi:serine/threonine protein kinase